MPILQSPATETSPFRLLAAGHAVLIGVTWPLWTPQVAFPQIPLIERAGECPPTVEWLLLICLLVSLSVGCFSSRRNVLRVACLTSMVCSLALVFVDQHRLQPWAWEFLIVSFVLAFADSFTSRQLWQWLVIGIYVWSAWSKIDYGFCLQHGPFLLDGICKSLHLPAATQAWPDAVRFGLSGAIPLFELAVAAGLCWSRTRRLALFGAVIMHLGLLLALGPFGHNHKPGVLVWNLFFLIQNCILFGRHSSTFDASNVATTSAKETGIAWGNLLARIVVSAALAWPVLEPFGLCDHWPAWAVYAARPERVSVLIHRDELESLPNDLKRFLWVNDDEDEWPLLRIDRWSLDSVEAPIYPQDRFQVGVALDLLRKFDLRHMQIVIEGPANRWNGRRTVRRYEGTEEITQLAESYRVNAIARGR